jgi:hypothetical protein
MPAGLRQREMVGATEKVKSDAILLVWIRASFSFCSHCAAGKQLQITGIE